MSRNIEVKVGGELHRTLIETIASNYECKHLINEVCTCADCEQCCDYPSPTEYCCDCEYFEKEDGVIEE